MPESDRLTKRNERGGIAVWDMPAALKKLSELEDAEQDGRLVRLPVKIGSKVYRYRYTGKGNDYCVVEWTVSAITFNGSQIAVSLRHGQDEFFHCAYGGANWRGTYMTRTEAETALKGRVG